MFPVSENTKNSRTFQKSCICLLLSASSCSVLYFSTLKKIKHDIIRKIIVLKSLCYGKYAPFMLLITSRAKKKEHKLMKMVNFHIACQNNHVQNRFKSLFPLECRSSPLKNIKQFFSSSRFMRSKVLQKLAKIK